MKHSFWNARILRTMRADRFARKSRNQQQYPRILIVSEGAVTELQYFEAIKRSRAIRSAQIEYLPPGPTSPVQIVRKAQMLKERNRRIDPFDAVWCVFDTEAKLTQASRFGLNEAIGIAKANDIMIAMSNPCFEIWLLLHKEDIQSWIDSNALQTRCSFLKLVDAKHICDAQFLLSQYDVARSRALALEAKHDREGRTRIADRNPSSYVFRLVDQIFDIFPSR